MGVNLPKIKFDLQINRSNNFLKTDDDANSNKFEPFEKFSRFFSNGSNSGAGVPNLGKGAKRTCFVDEAAKPKYNVHHYIHDSKYEIIR